MAKRKEAKRTEKIQVVTYEYCDINENVTKCMQLQVFI